MADPFQSGGGTQWVLREKRIVIQDADGKDVFRIGRGDDDTWTVQMVDDTGQERVRIGQVGASYGLRVRNSSGQIVFDVDNEGQGIPFLQLSMGSTGGISGMAIQSSSFGGDGLYLVDFIAVAPRVALAWAALFPLSHTSTMDVRVRYQRSGVDTVLDHRTGLASSTTGTVDEALPTNAVGSTGRLIVEGRRASGSDLLGLNIALQPRNYG